MEHARLTRYGLLSITGEQAREFLHGQLTNDIANLPRQRAALAGWCSPKGRLLASFLVIPVAQGFLLQLARDLAPAVSKRLSMFVLRAKVKVADESADWAQFGMWGGDVPGAPGDELGTVEMDGSILVRIGPSRLLALSRDAGIFEGRGTKVAEEKWTLEEIRAGRAHITSATQDQFVPQMVNYEAIGAVNFQKGCYPGQEIVARAQYRGQVKRRMKRLQAPAGPQPLPGQEFQGGVVVDAAPIADGFEVLAVVPIDAA
jgi:tRNA-modifying protein YgfZ